MNRLQLPRTPVGIAYVLVLGALAATSAGLAVALIAQASTPPAVTLARTGEIPRILRPGFVPDAFARDVAAGFIATWENTSPENLDPSLDYVLSRISPDLRGEVAPLLEERRRSVREADLVSQLLLDDPTGAHVIRNPDSIDVVLQGSHRIYVAGKLVEAEPKRYRVRLQAAQPTRDNPTGLFVQGLSIASDPEESEENDDERTR